MPSAPQVIAPPTRKPRAARIILWIAILLLVLLLAIPALFLAGIAFTNLVGSSNHTGVGHTRATAKTVEGMLKTYNFDYGNYPASLNALIPKYTERLPVDAWKTPLIYQQFPDGSVLLISLGADGVRGGIGPNTDLWWHLSGSSTTEGTGQPPSPK